MFDTKNIRGVWSRLNKKVDGGRPRDLSIVTGALLTVSILIIQSYLAKSPKEIDPLQEASLVAFSVAIPGLSIWYFLSKLSDKIDIRSVRIIDVVVNVSIFLISAISAFVGMGLTIWRYSELTGFVFFIVSIFVGLHAAYIFQEAVDAEKK